MRKPAEMAHCKYCGDEMSPYGFIKHENACKHRTDEQRELARKRRAVQVTPMYASLNGKKRLRLCISVDLEQIKLLLPYLEIDKVEIN